jgi:hypothetical protein
MNDKETTDPVTRTDAVFAAVHANQLAVLAACDALLGQARSYLAAWGKEHRFGWELHGWMHALETVLGLLTSQAV